MWGGKDREHTKRVLQGGDHRGSSSGLGMGPAHMSYMRRSLRCANMHAVMFTALLTKSKSGNQKRQKKDRKRTEGAARAPTHLCTPRGRAGCGCRTPIAQTGRRWAAWRCVAGRPGGSRDNVGSKDTVGSRDGERGEGEREGLDWQGARASMQLWCACTAARREITCSHGRAFFHCFGAQSEFPQRTLQQRCT